MHSQNFGRTGKKVAVILVLVLLVISAGIYGRYYFLGGDTPAAPAPAVKPAPKPAKATDPVQLTFVSVPRAVAPAAPTPPAAPDPNLVSFEKDIKPLLSAACGSCHGANRPSGSLTLTSLDAALKGGKNAGKAVIAGHSDQSLIVLYASDAVAGHEMPPLRQRATHPALTADQLALIRNWVDLGAQ